MCSYTDAVVGERHTRAFMAMKAPHSVLMLTLTPCLTLDLHHLALINSNLGDLGFLAGYWDAKPEQLEKLRQLYTDVEDKIEGVEM